MKEYLESLNRSLIFKAMRTLFFVFPILMITRNIYVYKYGTYQWCNDLAECLTSVFTYHSMFALIIFSIIFCIAYLLETNVFPAIMFTFYGEYKKEIKTNLKDKEKAETIIKKATGTNVLLQANDEKVKRFIYSEIMYFPVMLILWLIGFNNLFCYLSIPIVVVLTIYLYKTLSYYIAHFKNEPI